MHSPGLLILHERWDVTEATLLDALVWATLTDQARASRIAAALILEHGWLNADSLPASDIIKAVRHTKPPHGRGKAIQAMVREEIARQLPIHRARREAADRVEQAERLLRDMEHRYNVVYASVFRRPMWEPGRSYPGSWCNWETRRKWEEEEKKRDSGDCCIHLIRQGDHLVALLRVLTIPEETSYRQVRMSAVAVAKRGESSIITILRDKVSNLGEAVVSLGGPEVRSAISHGIRVETDWPNRQTIIHYQSNPKVIPWLTAGVKGNGLEDTITHGEAVTYLESGDDE